VKKRAASELTIEKSVAAGSETSTVGYSFQELFPWSFYPRAVLSTSVYSAKTVAGVASPTPVIKMAKFLHGKANRRQIAIFGMSISRSDFDW